MRETDAGSSGSGLKRRSDVKRGTGKANKKTNIVSWVLSILFYIALVCAVVVVSMTTPQGGRPRVMFGYSMFIVMTGSMQSQIPQESFVLTKHVDPGAIRVGDDITYMRSDQTTVTHQVVSIIEDYQQSGMRGFQTKGIENPGPDPEIVYADNVVGEVVFHSAGLGDFLSWLKDRVWLVIGLLAVLAALIGVLRYLVRTGKKPPRDDEKGEMKEKPAPSVQEFPDDAEQTFAPVELNNPNPFQRPAATLIQAQAETNPAGGR